MKKFLLIFVLAIFSTTAFAQLDLQLHYLWVKNEKARLLSTVEYFHPDKYGSTYFFIDMEYGTADGLHGMNSAYWEISRGLKFWKSSFEIHLEYDGGFGQFAASPFNGAYQINDAWLFGGQYTWASKDFSRIFTLQLLYKDIRFAKYFSYQVTSVWNLNFFNRKFTFEGFFDFWREKKNLEENKSTGYVFITQPQFWYNVTKHLSLGSEIEIENNLAVYGWRVNPTAAVKWTF